ncbi:hypothetical protein ZIOFF_029084 [Zingiber officinale]|uniref:Protein kinase domain-containing protein n=1 Tax=Zingiber officinale TaxID=94328 RepID=A0A8J5H7M7_ZINOF|nr:hypothetical protein ZIOFF_029084 [Zingiber officinale]
MKIALETAKGFAFLHEAETPVIFRDFKASNILLEMVGALNYGRKAKPIEKLEAAYRAFLVCSTKRHNKKQIKTGASIVTGTRYVRHGGVHGWNLMRKFTSRGANVLAQDTSRFF